MKKVVFVFALLSLLTLLLVACGGNTGSNYQGPNTVHMGDNLFLQDKITIKKGSKLTLVDDSMQSHIIENGMWTSDGTQKPGMEPGAPKVDAQFTDGTPQSFGPFNTAGTFHLYCTVHEGMNLTVIVQ
jgi:plastocyanin